jgi:hypothetical protein
MTVLSTIGPCTIRGGESLSDAVDCSGSTRIARIITPDQWDNADLTFVVSPDGVAWHDLYNVTIPGNLPGPANAYHTFLAVVAKPHPGSLIVLPPNYGNDVTWLKVRSGTAIVPVPQSADRMFSFIVEMPDTIPAPARRGRGAAGKRGWLRLGRGSDGATVAIWRSSGGSITVTPPGPTAL